ncbi:MAG: hypothetical protein L6V81_01775 [Clostridium sp.]|nr:MAG: hypothetical protein L6V81_01775 [Clostridium sp.]
MNSMDTTLVYVLVRSPLPSKVPPKYLITTIRTLLSSFLCIISIRPLVVPFGSLSAWLFSILSNL